MNWTYTGKDCNNSDIYTKSDAVMIVNKIRGYVLYYSDKNSMDFVKRSICKKNEIIEGNKLLGRFMKWIDPNGNYMVLGAEMKYHSSWDWLMPIVEKIENRLKWKYEVEIGNNLYVTDSVYRCTIHDAGKAYYNDVENASKINSVYLAVVQFIKWYNQNCN